MDADYKHNEAWHDGNGYAHVRAALMKPSLSIPIVEGRLLLTAPVLDPTAINQQLSAHKRYVVRFKGLTCSRSRKSSDHFLDRSWLKCGSPSIGPRVFSNWSAREEVNPWIDKRSCAHCSNNTGRFTGGFRLPSKSITRGMVAPIGVRLSGS